MIPVFWVSRFKNILSRGYADQGLLEAIFDHSLWRPPHPFTFKHYENVGMPGTLYENFPEADGAVVIIPCRHHAESEDVQWLTTNINRLAWSLVLLCGDEEWSFPWQEIPETDTRKVWVMQPRPEHAGLSGLIPGGWYPETDTLLNLAERLNRPLDWFFAGQVRDNTRRQQLMKAIRRIPNGRQLATEGYMQGMPKDQYFTLMAQAKVVPSPSGPMTVDTARTFEALEAGCIPIVDLVTPRGEDYDYWTLLFGPDHPIKGVHDWFELPAKMQKALREWPVSANRHFTFWQSWKRKIAHQFHDDIQAVRGERHQSDVVDDEITVIVTTSPAPLHPSTDHIEQVINSIRAQLPHSEIIIACDGIHHLDEDRRADYNEYLRRLTHLCNFEWSNVLPIISDTWQHQANMTRRAMEYVTTHAVLFVEHDTPLEGEIHWNDLASVIYDGSANMVRLHFDVEIHPDHKHLLVGDVEDHGSYLQRMFVWWQRPHLASADYYREILDKHFPPTCRTMVEDPMHQIVSIDRDDNGPAAWENWRIWVYSPEGSMKRSGHLDSRGDAPKHEMRFV